MSEALAEVLIRLAATFLGTALALVFQPPRSLAGAARRTFISVPCGLIFYPQVADWLDWPRNWDNDFAAIVLTAAVSWWVFGAVTRVLEIWKPPKSG